MKSVITAWLVADECDVYFFDAGSFLQRALVFVAHVIAATDWALGVVSTGAGISVVVPPVVTAPSCCLAHMAFC